MNKISRKEALASNLSKYFTGKLCKQGHISERYASNGACVQCSQIKSKSSSDYQRNYYLQNKSKILDHRKSYRKDNPTAFKDYYAQNKLNLRQKDQIKRDSRPGWQSLNCMDSICRDITPKWSNYEGRLAIYWEAALLRSKGYDVEVDHVIPRTSDTVCGLHCEDNLQIISRTDNIRKHNNYQKDW
jgi:hypothetical protein